MGSRSISRRNCFSTSSKRLRGCYESHRVVKNYLSEAELGQLNYVQGEYSYAYAKLYSGSYTRYTASVDKTTGKVTWSPKDDKVDKENSAKGILEAAYDTYESDVNAGNFGNISEIKLNAAVAEAKTTLEVTVAELGIKRSFGCFGIKRNFS